MSANFIYILASILIVVFWIWIGASILPKMKEEGKFKISIKEIRLLCFVGLMVIVALVYTYFKTDGTFVW